MKNYILFRQICGVLFLLDLISYLPWLDVFLGRGYGQPTRWNGEAGIAAAAIFWVLACLGLIFGILPLASSIVLLLLFRCFYIRNRWTSLFRGGGAPGFMSHFVALYLFLFEFANWIGSGMDLDKDVSRLLRVDFGLILLCSGIYKATSGYLQGEGMEYGLANPMWGYWFKIFSRIRPSNPYFRIQDIIASLTQIAAGLLILVPRTQAWGAALVVLMFFSLLFVVRLGRLAVLMMAIPLLMLPELDTGARLTPISTFKPDLPLIAAVSHWAIIGFTVLLPLVKLMQYLNFYGNKTFPTPFQTAFSRFTNFVPIIIWRVFTPDVTNFFIRISERVPGDPVWRMIADENTAYSYANWQNLRNKCRFLHVTENIALTSVFTLLRYFKSNRELFEKRLLKYAETVTSRRDCFVRFEYVSIVKAAGGFDFVPSFLFEVDLTKREITEEKLSESANYQAPAKHSRIREATGFGTYQVKR